MSLFDHIFGFYNKSFLNIRGILSTFLRKPVRKSFKMNSSDRIILSFSITDLNVIILIQASENIKNNNSMRTNLTWILSKNLEKIIFRLIKLTISKFAISSSYKIDLFRISFFYIKLMLNNFTPFCVLVINNNPPFIIKQVTINVLISLFGINIVCNHRLSAKSIYQIDFISINDRNESLISSMGLPNSRYNLVCLDIISLSYLIFS